MRLLAAVSTASELDTYIKVAAVIGPLVGVWLGTLLTRRSSRDSFFRERVFAEIGRRRETVASFKQAIWAYQAEVQSFLEVVEKIISHRSGGKQVEPKFNPQKIRELEKETKQAFAQLESFVTVPVQQSAFAAMEAVTKSFNKAANGEVLEARAMLASYSHNIEQFSATFNKEIDDFNAIIYSSITPIWRAVLDRAKWKPLPYHTHPDVSAIANRPKLVKLVDEKSDGADRGAE